MMFEIQAPGRVNLLGEHTDYNGLPVLPMAIEPCIRIRGQVREDRVVRARLLSESAWEIFELSHQIPKHPQGHWMNYIKAGMSGVLNGCIPDVVMGMRGCELEISGNIPQGVGLSSSSALVVASALALLRANEQPYIPLALAEQLAQAEQYVGTRGGGMDQAVCLCGLAGHLLKIDFFPLCVIPVPLPETVTVVICDSLVCAKKTENALHAYNLRAVECKVAARLLRNYLIHQHHPADFQRVGDLLRSPWQLTYSEAIQLINNALKEYYTYNELVEAFGNDRQLNTLLKDYSFTEPAHYSQLTFACGKRYRHVLTDAWRVERSAELLRQGDIAAFGQLMCEGQDSARDDFEISCPELDRLTAMAISNGALGSRLTGAGFGGCTVNLVPCNEVEAFVERMSEYYRSNARAGERQMEELVFTSSPGNGATIRG